MNRNYSLLALVCMGLSVPLVIYLSNRRSADTEATVRFATMNLALNRGEPGALLAELRGGGCAPARQLAEVLQRVRPDVVLLNELDHDDGFAAVEVFVAEYLQVPQNRRDPLDYGYRYCNGVNTGVPVGVDVDGDGAVGGPGDAHGYGVFPGQYGMVLLSRYPILEDRVRTFRELRWSEMPSALRPDGCYSDDAWSALRLSSKSHWDVPIGIGEQAQGMVVHALCSHPTPPAFDGPEDRNGRRNHDEIRFWVDYLDGGDAAAWIHDDGGGRGGLDPAAQFVVLGDLNCDPVDGDSRREALRRLLGHARVQDPEPRGDGGTEQRLLQFGTNMQQQGDAACDTADFDDTVGEGPGNLRVDYVLPSRGLEVVASGVFWPRSHDPLAKLAAASDHRLVWVDLRVR